MTTKKSIRPGIRWRKWWLLMAGAISLGLLAAMTGIAAAGSDSVTPGLGPKAYSAQIANGSYIQLSPTPTVLIKSPRLPVGNYLVHFGVGALLGPDDNVACYITENGVRPDLLSGTAGNGSNRSGVYGTAEETEVLHISNAGTALSVNCEDRTSGSNSGAVRWISALAVGTWTNT